MRKFCYRPQIVRFAFALGAASFATCSAATDAQPVRNVPLWHVRVVDGDTVEINGEKMRLFGVDAPEGKQVCTYADMSPYDCGAAATRELRALLSFAGLPVIDRKGRDQYGRTIVILRDQTGLNINCELVARGVAWAYTDYSTLCIPQEDSARAQRRGVFHGVNMPPWEFRRKQKLKSNGLIP